MKLLHDLKTKIFADGADKASMLQLYANPLIKGMTTNPTLMNKIGIRDYEAYAHDVLASVRGKLKMRERVGEVGGLGPQIWTFFTYSLLHGSWMHLGLNGIWLLAFGTPTSLSEPHAHADHRSVKDQVEIRRVGAGVEVDIG